MKLVVHDLTPEEWEIAGRDYAGWEAVSDNGGIKPCVGCFCCWNKTPGKCVIQDGYGNMGELVHKAEEVTFISRYSFGCVSGFIKNTFDRSLGYVLPQFEVVRGETHHKKRYDEDKPFTFIFYGSGLSEMDKNLARRYVSSVCANFRTHVKDVIFRDCGGLHVPETVITEADAPAETGKPAAGKVLLLNGSMRNVNGNSAKLARQLSGRLCRETLNADLKNYLGNYPEMLPLLDGASDIVLCVPLYVDGLPSQIIRFMEWMQREYRGGAKRVYVLANMGLYESRQLVNLFAQARQWSERMGFDYCGGLGVSAGELIGGLMDIMPFDSLFMKKTAQGMDALSKAIDACAKTDDIYTEPHRFPRPLYILIANRNWNRTARLNGLQPKDLYRQI